MAKLSLTSLGPGLVAGLQSLSRKEYLSCEEGDALVAAALCRQLGERSFVLVVDHQLCCGLWAGVLLHSWLLQPAVSSWAWGTARTAANRRCSEAQPPAVFLLCPCLPHAVPCCPSTGRCDRAGPGFAVAGLLLIN